MSVAQAEGVRNRQLAYCACASWQTRETHECISVDAHQQESVYHYVSDTVLVGRAARLTHYTLQQGLNLMTVKERKGARHPLTCMPC